LFEDRETQVSLLPRKLMGMVRKAKGNTTPACKTDLENMVTEDELGTVEN
jgi:hypothetical protein